MTTRLGHCRSTTAKRRKNPPQQPRRDEKSLGCRPATAAFAQDRRVYYVIACARGVANRCGEEKKRITREKAVYNSLAVGSGRVEENGGVGALRGVRALCGSFSDSTVAELIAVGRKVRKNKESLLLYVRVIYAEV